MQPFPVSSSLLSAPHIAGFVQAVYDLKEQTTGSLLRSGINDTYRIDCGTERFVFRVYSFGWRTETEILEEIRLLEMLSDNGIAVARPLKNRRGHYLNDLIAPEGKRMGVLFSFANGKKQAQLPESVHFNAGEIMARMHLLTEDIVIRRATYTPENLIYEPLKELSAFLPTETEELIYMHDLGERLAEAMQGFNARKLRRGVVHFDLWFDNMNVTQSDEITLFDFDFCGNGWLCHDVAYYVLQLHNVERDPDTCRRKYDAFLEGYTVTAPLSDEERRALPVLGLSSYFFYLGVQCRCFDNWSNSFLNEDYLRRFITALVRRYAELHGI